MKRAVIALAAVLSVTPATSFARRWSVQTEAGNNTRSLQSEGIWARKQTSASVGRLMVGASQQPSYMWYLRHGRPGDPVVLPKTAADQQRLMRTLSTVQRRIQMIHQKWGTKPLDPKYGALLTRLTDLEKRLLYITQLMREREKLAAKRMRGKKGMFDGKRKVRWEPLKVAAATPRTSDQLRTELRELRRREGARLTVFTRPVANPLRVLWNTSALTLASRDVPRVPGSPRRWVIAPAF
jgi:hypothetical protein